MIEKIITQMGVTIPANIIRHLDDLYHVIAPSFADKDACRRTAECLVKAYLDGRDEPLSIAVGLCGTVNYGYMSRSAKVTLSVMDFDVDGNEDDHIPVTMSDGGKEVAWVYPVSCHEEPGFDFKQLEV